MLGEDGIKNFPELRIDLNFDDMISENRFGQLTLSEKINTMQNEQMVFPFDSNSSLKMTENNIDYTNILINPPEKVPKNTNACDEGSISFNIDKIEIMTKYFPHNNFDKVVKSWNIISLKMEIERKKKLRDFEKKREELNSIVQKKKTLRKRLPSVDEPLSPIRKSYLDGEGTTKAYLQNEDIEEITYSKLENSREIVANQNIYIEDTLNIKKSMNKTYNSSLVSGSSDEIMYDKQNDEVRWNIDHNALNS